MRGRLVRFEETTHGTFGKLKVAGVEVWIGELPWRNNQRQLSRIPAGRYTCSFLPLSASGKYRQVWHVHPVEGRSGILIHRGNFCGDVNQGKRSDVLGCLLPGIRLGRLAGQQCVLASRAAMNLLRQATSSAAFELEIIDGMA